MKKFLPPALTAAVFLILTALFSNAALAAKANKVSGFWRTYNLKGISQSIVKISIVKNKVLGKIVRILPVNGQKSTDICTKCKGKNFNKPILGLTIIRAKRAQNNEWIHGKILDPSSGKTYDCKIRLAQKGKILQIHAYIGLSILGRTVNWARVG